MTDAPPIEGTRRTRFIQKLATLIVRATYRQVTVYEYEDPVLDGPQLSVSNHFGGFADPLLLVDVMPRLPRIIARDQIWKIPVAGWVMNWLGAIPVHKPEDGPAKASRNDQMFASAYEALEEGDHLMIFPEGVTQDDPSIAPIKTGAARIALGARSRGAHGIQITPAGIHYEDKAALRSRVSIQIGRPLDLDAGIDTYVEPGAEASPENRQAVRALTDDIETRLRRVAPDFADWREAKTMTTAAEILLRSAAADPGKPVALGERDVLASHLGRRPPESKARVMEAVGGYMDTLDSLGIDDQQAEANITGGGLLRYSLGWLVLSILLLPFALAGAIINFIPFLIVKGVGLLRVAPAVLATLKPMTAILAFGIAWGLVVWRASSDFGAQGAASAMLLMPVYLATAIVVSERLVELWRAFRAWRTMTSQRRGNDVVPLLHAQRRYAVETVVEAL